MTIFGVDEEIVTLSSGLQIGRPSTSLVESPSVTWSDGDEDGEIASDVVAAGSGAIDCEANLVLTDLPVATTKG